MPRGDRPAPVQRARDPVAQRGRRERVDREPEAEADEHLRRDRPDELRARQQREAREPAGDQHRPGDRLRPRPGAHAPEQRPGRQRRRRHRRDRDRRHGGRAPPALHEQQHQQEQRRRERRRQQRQRQVGQHVRAIRRRVQVRPRRATRPRSAIAAGSATSTTGICTTKIDRHENADVKQPAGHRAERRPGDAGRRPPPRSRALGPGRLDEQLEASDDHQRAPDRLDRPRRDQHAQRRRHRAYGRRGREDRQATGRRHGRIPAHAHPRRRHRHQREHEVERDQDPRDLPHLGPEVPQDLRQRQRHHARVAKHHGDDQRQRRDHAGASPTEDRGWSLRSALMQRELSHPCRHPARAVSREGRSARSAPGGSLRRDSRLRAAEPPSSPPALLTRGAVLPRSVYNFAKRRADRLPSVQIGRHRRFHRSEVERWLARPRV